VMGVGFYVGSRDGGYTSHWFSSGNLRTPANANEIAIKVSKIFETGELTTDRDNSFKIYSYVENTSKGLCEAFPNIANFAFTLSANSASSGEPARITADINCKENGSSALFMRSFCSVVADQGSLEFFNEAFEFENTKFSFSDILDGFPPEWYIENLNVQFYDSREPTMFGIKPLQNDIAASGDKFVIDCNSF